MNKKTLVKDGLFSSFSLQKPSGSERERDSKREREGESKKVE